MRTRTRGVSIAAGLVMLTGAAPMQSSKSLNKCPEGSVLSGTVCMDAYEASVWRVPEATTSNRGLVRRIQLGKATLDALRAAGATQLGVSSDDYAPCGDNGQNCTNDIYAVSLPGVTPSSRITWFQAQQACKNARKRLPSNAEWQAAVAGTPEAGPSGTMTDCDTSNDSAVATGSRAACVSEDGVFDMVGNLEEWVADWVPQVTRCASANAGAGPTTIGLELVDAAGEPGVLLRASSPGKPFNPVIVGPTYAVGSVGFRCAR